MKFAKLNLLVFFILLSFISTIRVSATDCIDLNILKNSDNYIWSKNIFKNDYKSENIRIKDSSGFFINTYEDVYIKLNNAINYLTANNKILIKNTTNGSLTITYKNKSDKKITITSQANTGYKLESLKVTNIIGYNDDDIPILGENVMEYTIGNNNSYDYTIQDSDIYIEPAYTKINYKLNFKVDENGNIYDNLDNEIDSTVTVSHGDDYTLKITSDEGYEINKILVNNQEYELIDGKVIIKSITQDTNVVINFKLKKYSIIIGKKDYLVTYGTTYKELLRMININKDGYIFKGLNDNDGNLIKEDYIVNKISVLTPAYEKNNKKSDNNDNIKNPNTNDPILRYVVLLIFALVILVSMVNFKNKIINMKKIV